MKFCLPDSQKKQKAPAKPALSPSQKRLTTCAFYSQALPFLTTLHTDMQSDGIELA